ncbi:MAG: pantoate--beta-alanine ligase [bacterium]|nr:pantoate--beta-alanine ligase [bacterium]
MKLLRTAEDLGTLDSLRDGNLTVVPTMGALHEGHLSLVRAAASHGPVVVTAFVNPTQFAPGEDYDAYPRDLQQDLDLLAPLAPAAVFAPDTATVYGDGRGVTIQPGRYAEGLCGADRPGHFAGVLTVVARLFGLVRPDVAVFGRKDAQQCLVIGEMVADLRLPVRLVDVPTVRENDGLAMSSRNRYLDHAERARAACLWRGLSAARALAQTGERSAARLREAVAAALADADEIEYIQVRSVGDWTAPDRVTGRTLLAVAARVGPARLIDNLVLDITDDGAAPCGLLDHGGNA